MLNSFFSGSKESRSKKKLMKFKAEAESQGNVIMAKEGVVALILADALQE